jgi:hypothetical protein
LAKNSKQINDEKKEKVEDGSRKSRKKNKFGDIIDEAIVADEARNDNKWKKESPAGEIERSRKHTNLAK